MDAFVLNEKWQIIHPEDSVRILRIDSVCKPDLSIGIDTDGKRCLTLKSASLKEEYLDKNEFSNLSIVYLPVEDRIIIRVLDEYFWDLFNDFVISIYNKIHQIEDDEACVKEFFRTFNRWAYFFDEKRGAKLSEEILIGLFGELCFMDYLLSHPSLGFKISDIEQSWVGPYDKGHDFEFFDIDFEVKTKPGRSLDVNISSEYQLQEDLGKSLELVIIDIDKNYIEGISLKDLINSIKEKVIASGGDLSFIVEGLKQKNISFNELESYDNYRYKADKIAFYDCLAVGFPRLQRNLLPQSIRKVRYQIRLTNLNEFIKLEQSL
ncbi:PD-(D/E)XK motif protein [Sphingobacterium luzhongxinii]|uniref:PD-(D/E)XK motif protein n=1 Tax=Sphingobacterium luzhongxinii TaxID=2654181 RepID=UPI0013DD0ECA|nr:PD-(D/E)XK motif protein [Sphingobacterium sp. xlx-73]